LILALGILARVEVGRAELRLVLIWVVEFLHAVMGERAGVPLGTVAYFSPLAVLTSRISSHMWAHFRLVGA
jgi:hypothetical protein